MGTLSLSVERGLVVIMILPSHPGLYLKSPNFVLDYRNLDAIHRTQN